MAQVSHIGTRALARVSMRLTSANTQLRPYMSVKWLFYCITGSNSTKIVIILLFTSARPLENQIDVISCRRRSFEHYVANIFTCEGSVAPGPITGSSPVLDCFRRSNNLYWTASGHWPARQGGYCILINGNLLLFIVRYTINGVKWLFSFSDT